MIELRQGARGSGPLSFPVLGRPAARCSVRWTVDAARGYAFDAEGGERLTFGGGTVLIKAATPALTVWAEPAPLLDTPLHVHMHEDELFQHPGGRAGLRVRRGSV